MGLDRRELLSGSLMGGAAALAAGRAAATTAVDGPSRARWSGRADKAQAAAMESLRRYVELHREAYNLPGMTVCWVDRAGGGGFITSGWANVDRRTPVGPQHLFQIGSISKSVAALAAFRLIDEGKLSADARLDDLMPEINVAAGDGIRLEHLLNHTSGLPDDAPLVPRDTGQLWSGYAPGSHWSYSNIGYDLIGRILARTDKRPYPEVITRRVLAPLGMTDSIAGLRAADRALYASGYSPAQADRPYPQGGALAPASWVDSDDGAGCVAATAADMARYLRFLLALSQGKGGPVFSDAAAKAFISGGADAPGWAPGARYAHGLATVEIDGRKYLHHTGGMVAFSSSLHVDPEAGVACFASTNVGMTNYRPRNVTAYACQLLRRLHAGGPEPTPKPVRVKVAKAAEYQGRFTALGGEAVEAKADGDRLLISAGGASAAGEPVGDGVFLATLPGFETSPFAFVRESGRVTRVWHANREFVADGVARTPPPPPEVAALAGRFDNDSPWLGVIRITARGAELWPDGGSRPLQKMSDGAYRMGDEDWSPERVRYDAVLDGRPQRLSFSGTDFMRRFD